MFELLASAFKQKEIRSKFYWTFAILAVYQFGTYITVPHVNARALAPLMNETSLLSVLNLFSGGGLASYSIFALGISPYVTAQIVMQLLQMDIVPKFVEWSKQGETGRRKLTNVSRYLTIGLAFFQSIGMTVGLNSLGVPLGVQLLKDTSFNSYLLVASVMTIGTMLATWLGEMITVKGIGRGTSMIIFAGIVARVIPNIWMSIRTNLFESPMPTGLIRLVTTALGLLIVITFVTWFYGAIRKVPMQYSRSDVAYGEESYLPIRVNVAGVMPVIFASALLTTPQTILQAFVNSWSKYDWYQTAIQIFSLQTWQGTIAYALMIIGFTYFYGFVQVNPEKMTEQFQKNGSYIIGVRPGPDTKKFLGQLIVNLSLPGSIFLATISVFPLLAQNFGIIDSSASIGLSGTSLLIVIGVVVDLVRQIEGLTLRNKYDGLMRSHNHYTKNFNKGAN